MQRFPLSHDERLGGTCFNCGSTPETGDHVPPKIFLDKPYPANIMQVPSCTECNSAPSLDEQYVASLIEVVLCGTTDPSRLHRDKIAKTLEHAPALKERLDQAATVHNGGYAVRPELERVDRVLEKIARGLWHFDNVDAPVDMNASTRWAVVPLSQELKREFFESSAGSSVVQCWGEIGSHGFSRSILGTDRSDYGPDWVDLQVGRFSYSVDNYDGGRVRMIFSEYLHAAVYLECV